MDFSCIDIRELLDSTLSKWFENPGDKSPNLDDLGIQLDCNDTTKDTSKDTKERFVEPSVIPQVYVNEYNEDIDPTWTNMENAKWASKKEADLVGETDQEGDVFMYNYRSDQEEPKKDFFTDEIYPSGIEPRFYMKAEEETSQTSVVNNVVDNVKDSVSEKVTPQVGGSSGTPRMYGTKPSGDKQMKNYAFELTTIEKIAEEMVVEADLESKKPYLLKDLEKSNADKKEYDNIIQLCNKADPTGNKAVYTQWILKQYINDNFKGEEDVDKFKDTLNKFTKLKNSKKIQPADLNQYKSYGELAENVNSVLEELGGYTSKREEETTKATEGIQKIDQDGDVELYLVTTPEAAAKEFRNTHWCVKDPKYFNMYAETDKNFYYFKKGGQPYMLLHTKDFKDVYDSNPGVENLKDVSNLMVKYNLPRQSELLTHNIITKEDGELFNTLANKAVESGDSFALLRKGIITREDGELFNKAVNDSLKNRDIYTLLVRNMITREDGELFNKAVNSAIEYGDEGWLLGGVLTREDGELFNKAVNKYIERGGGCKLIRDGIITREDGDLFNKAVDDALKHNEVENLLIHNLITREDGELFNKAVNDTIESGWGSNLVWSNIITQEELDNITNDQDNSQEAPLDESTNDDTNKESAFEFTDINKLADFVQEFNRQDELTDEQKNKFVNRLPVEEANKDQKEELIEKAKKVNKPVTYIPKDLNFPFIEDEMSGNKLFYTDTDFLLDDLYQ